MEGGSKGLVNGGSGEDGQGAEIEKLQRIIGKQAIQIEILKKRRSSWGEGRSGRTLQGPGLHGEGLLRGPWDIQEQLLPAADEGRSGEGSTGGGEDLLARIKRLKTEHPFWGIDG